MLLVRTVQKFDSCTNSCTNSFPVQLNCPFPRPLATENGRFLLLLFAGGEGLFCLRSLALPGDEFLQHPVWGKQGGEKANPGTHWHVIAHTPRSPASLPLLSVFQNLPTFALYMRSETVLGERDRAQCVYFIC